MNVNFEGVDDLFKNAPDHRDVIRVNPVTGNCWVPALDLISRQRTLARRALAARDAFAISGPPDCQPLPLSYAQREELKVYYDVKWIVALFARSLAYRDFEFETHPPFAIYAPGMLAIHHFAENVKLHQPSLFLRYPPAPLAGLHPGGLFEGSWAC